jgi:hypothetical protein
MAERQLKPGDLISCKIKNLAIVSAYSSHDEERDFEIIGADLKGYYLYVPEYYGLKDTAVITSYVAQSLNIDKKYINGLTIYIGSNYISKILKILDGCSCKECGEFSEYSVPNQEDGTMVCWRCVHYPFYQ